MSNQSHTHNPRTQNIGEVGKVVLLFLAALWIMIIAARSGVSGVAITKVHAAYSLGASKWQNPLSQLLTILSVVLPYSWSQNLQLAHTSMYSGG